MQQDFLAFNFMSSHDSSRSHAINAVGRGGRVGRACDFGSIGCGFAARTRKLIRHHVAAFEQSCDHWRSAHAPWYFCGACSRTLT